MANFVFVIRQLDGGGAERQLINLTKGLAGRGHCVTIVTWLPGGAFEADIAGTRVKHLVVAKNGPSDLVGFFHRMVRTISGLKADVIHGYLDPGNFAASVVGHFLALPPIVWGIRESFPLLAHHDLGGRLLFHVNRWISGTADLVIANSNSGLVDLGRMKYRSKAMAMIPNGIDTEKFRFLHEKRTEFRRRFAISEDTILIGMAARLHPVKGHRTFLQAAKEISKKRSDIAFIAGGAGVAPHADEIIRLIKSEEFNGIVRWIGFIHDMVAFNNGIDIATSASDSEGFSNSIAEAMACGTPCVVTDVGDSRLIVGNTGEVIPPHQPDALVEAWETIIAKLGAEISAACRRRISDNFSIEHLVESTESRLLRLIEKQNS